MRHSFRGVITFGLYSAWSVSLGIAFVTSGPSSTTRRVRRPTPATFEGEAGGEMATTGDARHHPSALRNRGFISGELVKWIAQAEGQGDGDGAGRMLEIASGTGELLL